MCERMGEQRETDSSRKHKSRRSPSQFGYFSKCMKPRRVAERQEGKNCHVYRCVPFTTSMSEMIPIPSARFHARLLSPRCCGCPPKAAKGGTACRMCKEVHAISRLFVEGDWQGALNALCHTCYCQINGEVSGKLSVSCRMPTDRFPMAASWFGRLLQPNAWTTRGLRVLLYYGSLATRENEDLVLRPLCLKTAFPHRTRTEAQRRPRRGRTEPHRRGTEVPPTRLHMGACLEGEGGMPKSCDTIP
jgi:hypothetical protein